MAVGGWVLNVRPGGRLCPHPYPLQAGMVQKRKAVPSSYTKAPPTRNYNPDAERRGACAAGWTGIFGCAGGFPPNPRRLPRQHEPRGCRNDVNPADAQGSLPCGTGRMRSPPSRRRWGKMGTAGAKGGGSRLMHASGEEGIRTPGRELPRHRFSKPALSATQPPLQVVHIPLLTAILRFGRYCPAHQLLHPVHSGEWPGRRNRPGR